MLVSNKWPTHLILEKCYQIQDFIMEIENNSNNNESSNNENECVEGHSECNESIDNDGLSSDYEEMDSKPNELENGSYYEEDGYVTKNESCDNNLCEEEILDNNHVHNQEEQSNGEVLLNTDEILELLALDFETYANVSNNVIASLV